MLPFWGQLHPQSQPLEAAELHFSTSNTFLRTSMLVSRTLPNPTAMSPGVWGQLEWRQKTCRWWKHRIGFDTWLHTTRIKLGASQAQIEWKTAQRFTKPQSIWLSTSSLSYLSKMNSDHHLAWYPCTREWSGTLTSYNLQKLTQNRFMIQM